MLPEAAATHYRTRQRLTLATLGLTRRAWRMGEDFDASWRTVRRRLLVPVIGAQAVAARSAAAYVADALSETGQAVEPAGQVQPAAFAGTASDGRPLESLLYGAVTAAKTAVAAGQAPVDALERGSRWLDMAVVTQVADAARAAAGVAITARPGIGWVRMVNPPCCSRCAILAGRWYRWSSGFQRHSTPLRLPAHTSSRGPRRRFHHRPAGAA